MIGLVWSLLSLEQPQLEVAITIHTCSYRQQTKARQKKADGAAAAAQKKAKAAAGAAPAQRGRKRKEQPEADQCENTGTSGGRRK